MHSDKQRAFLNEPWGKGHIMCVCMWALALFQSAEGLTVTKTLGGVGWGVLQEYQAWWQWPRHGWGGHGVCVCVYEGGPVSFNKRSVTPRLKRPLRPLSPRPMLGKAHLCQRYAPTLMCVAEVDWEKVHLELRSLSIKMGEFYSEQPGIEELGLPRWFPFQGIYYNGSESRGPLSWLKSQECFDSFKKQRCSHIYSEENTVTSAWGLFHTSLHYRQRTTDLFSHPWRFAKWSQNPVGSIGIHTITNFGERFPCADFSMGCSKWFSALTNRSWLVGKWLVWAVLHTLMPKCDCNFKLSTPILYVVESTLSV